VAAWQLLDDLGWSAERAPPFLLLSLPLAVEGATVEGGAYETYDDDTYI